MISHCSAVSIMSSNKRNTISFDPHYIPQLTQHIYQVYVAVFIKDSQLEIQSFLKKKKIWKVLYIPYINFSILKHHFFFFFFIFAIEFFYICPFMMQAIMALHDIPSFNFQPIAIPLYFCSAIQLHKLINEVALCFFQLLLSSISFEC